MAVIIDICVVLGWCESVFYRAGLFPKYQKFLNIGILAGLSTDTELPHSGVQCLGVDAEDTGGPSISTDSPRGLFQCPHNVFPFGFLQSGEVAGRLVWRGHTPCPREPVTEDQPTTRGNDYGTFDDVFKFPDISGPMVAFQRVDQGLRNFVDRFSNFGGVSVHEVPDQQGDVLFPLAKAGKDNGEDVQTIIKVFPELAISD